MTRKDSRGSTTKRSSGDSKRGSRHGEGTLGAVIANGSGGASSGAPSDQPWTPVGFLVVAGTCLIAATGVLRWSVLSDQAPVTTPAIAAACRLIMGCLALWLVGRAALATYSQWAPQHHGKSLPALSWHLVALALGQLLAVLWIVARSGLHELSVRSTGVAIPITPTEVALILCSCLAYVVIQSRRAIPSLGAPPTRSAAWPFAAFLLLIALVCTAVALREMPRVCTLSSDPDNHAYWARMVMRHGVIPWDQGVLGIGSFGYPGGYAALNSAWCAVSGVSTIDAVTIQPVLQFLLGCLLIAGTAPLCAASCRRASAPFTSIHVLLIAFALMLTYWFALPYGMQRDRFFGEGTPRLSATMFTALIVMVWLAPIGVRLSVLARTARLALMAAALAVIALMNPITAAIPGMIVLAVGLDECRRRVRQVSDSSTDSIPATALALIVAGFAALLLSDPYLGERILGPRHSIAVASDIPATADTRPGSGLLDALSVPDAPLLPLFSAKQLASLVYGGISAPKVALVAWCVILIISFSGWFRACPVRAICWLALLPLLIAVHMAALCVKPVAGGSLPIYLVQPYLIDSANQCGAVMAFCGLGVGACIAVKLGRAWQRVGVALLLVCVSWIPRESAAQSNPQFVMRPRVTRLDGNMGVPTPADLEAVSFWSEYSRQFLRDHPQVSYMDAPKILIVGRPSDRGVEQWVFPTGGGRILPLESSLPAAFYYSHGGQWAYSNYLNRVCRTFDLEWLLEQNVAYVFIPEDRRGCLGISADALRGQSEVLFESEQCSILKLRSPTTR